MLNQLPLFTHAAVVLYAAAATVVVTPLHNIASFLTGIYFDSTLLVFMLFPIG